MKDNIYKRRVFEKLVAYEKAIDDIARATHTDVMTLIRESGIQDPLALLNRSISHWDKMLASSEILPEVELIDQLRNGFHLDVQRIARVFVPPDDLERKNGGSEETSEKGSDVNRVSLALDNQYGNRTFVVGYKSKKDLDSLSGSSKEQLKAIADKSPRIHHFIFENPVQYRGLLTDAVRRVLEGLEMLKLYPTYEEARQAVQRLQIKTYRQYKKRYREDLALPADPYAQYGDHFLGTYDFFGKMYRKTP